MTTLPSLMPLYSYLASTPHDTMWGVWKGHRQTAPGPPHLGLTSFPSPYHLGFQVQTERTNHVQKKSMN